MKERIHGLYKKYQSDVRFRVNVSLYRNLGVNLAYVLLQLCLGFRHHTVWYYSMAGYHFVIALVCFFLAVYTTKHAMKEDVIREWKLYRLCGILLFLLNLTLVGFVYYIMWQGRAFVHHEITVITMAVYTFYSFTMAIINFNKYRKYKRPVFTAGKMLGLATALVSMLTLERAMLATFGETSGEEFRLIMTGATGTGVTILILGMAIYMVVVANKNIKKIQKCEE